MLLQLGGVREGLVTKLAGLTEFVVTVVPGEVAVVVGQRAFLLAAQHHLHHTAASPLVATVVVTVDDPHVTDIALLVHEDLTAPVTGIARAILTLGRQVGRQVTHHSPLFPGCVSPARRAGSPLQLHRFLLLAVYLGQVTLQVGQLEKAILTEVTRGDMDSMLFQVDK